MQQQLSFHSICNFATWPDHYYLCKRNYMFVIKDLDYVLIKHSWNGSHCYSHQTQYIIAHVHDQLIGQYGLEHVAEMLMRNFLRQFSKWYLSISCSIIVMWLLLDFYHNDRSTLALLPRLGCHQKHAIQLILCWPRSLMCMHMVSFYVKMWQPQYTKPFATEWCHKAT